MPKRLFILKCRTALYLKSYNMIDLLISTVISRVQENCAPLIANNAMSGKDFNNHTQHIFLEFEQSYRGSTINFCLI